MAAITYKSLRQFSYGFMLLGCGFWLHLILSTVIKAHSARIVKYLPAALRPAPPPPPVKGKDQPGQLVQHRVLLRRLLEEAERRYKKNMRRRTRSFGSGGKRLRKLKRPRKLTMEEKMMWHPSAYVMEYYRPLYQCFIDERMGMWSDVGRWICRPDLLTGDSVVYTFGSEGISHFEVELYRRMQTEIHSFNPSIKKKHERSLVKREEFRFHKRGLGMEDNATLATLKSLMSLNGHSFIDLLKLDCGGCETEVFNQIFGDGCKIGQIILDVHRVTNKVKLQKMFQLLEDNGFRSFRMEQDWRNMDVVVFAFVHQSLVDPQSVKLDEEESKLFTSS